MVAAASHQVSKENDARDAARAKAESYKVSSLIRNAYQTFCSALSPAAGKVKELAQGADSRTLLIACYALYKLRPYITPAVQQLYLDVVNKLNSYITRFIASAGSSAATVALGSLLTVYNQSRNFLASAGRVLAAPLPAVVAFATAASSTSDPAPQAAASRRNAASSEGTGSSEGGGGDSIIYSTL